MQADFSDIRFTTMDGTNIPYWIESKTNSDTAEVWLKIPSITTTAGAEIWQYYGNLGISSVSSISDVMLFGDDFNRGDSATIGNGWTETEVGSANTILSNRHKSVGTDANSGETDDIRKAHGTNEDVIIQYTVEIDSVSGTNPYSHQLSLFGASQNERVSISFHGGNIKYLSGAGWNILQAFSEDTPYTIQITFHDGNNFDVEVIGGSSASGKAFWATANTNLISIRQHQSTSVSYTDDIFIRKYTATEPTWATPGNEQHRRRHPQFQN